MALATDPTAPTAATDPTATAQPAKKTPALPLAGASPTLSSPTNPTALPISPTTPSGGTGTQPVGPTVPAGPATTADPMAFQTPLQSAQSAGSTPPVFNPIDNSPNLGTGAYGANPLGNGDAAIASGALKWDEMSGSYVGADGKPFTGSAGAGAIGTPNTGSDRYTSPAEAASSAAQSQAYTAGQVANASTASGWNPGGGMSYSGGAGSYGGTTPTLNGLPTTTPAPGTSSTATTTPRLTPGPANDVNPSGQLPPAAQPHAHVGPSGVNANPGTLNGLPTTTTSNGTVGLTPTDPSNALTAQTISVGPTADRFKIANDQLRSEIENELTPQFNADARTIAAESFGAGRGVSGNNRTKEGDLALQHSRDLNNLVATSQAGALSGSIDDAYKNVGIEQQQQEFQDSQQKAAFSQGVTLQQMSDAENSQSFQQAYQKALLGYSGDPAQLYIQLAAEWAKNGATK